MKRLVLAAGLAALAATAPLAQEPAWGSAPPGLVAEPAELELGVVTAGSQAVATFHLRNPTQRDVRILAARPS